MFPERGRGGDETACRVPFDVCCAVGFADVDGHNVGVEFFVHLFVFAFVVAIIYFEIELSDSSSEICKREESSLGRPENSIQLFLINRSYHQLTIQVGAGGGYE